ncbi:heavy metal-associated isoprenylated plant protein 47-like [Setaria italica]|nr:heavy metal-associated isoprenylated plant protein 47-like [Setaria italica]XP_034601737.1 heavy metal-associated isoprenylated plant protein 47-like isoform X2 [Setaria viridis]
MSGDKSRSKALGLVASTHGVQSVAIEGRERNHLVVVGDGLDAVSLTSYLRKKVGSAQIVQVEVLGAGAAAEKTKPPATTTTSVLAAGSQQWQPRYYSGYYSRPAAVHPYAGQYGYGYDDPRPDADSSCAIM